MSDKLEEALAAKIAAKACPRIRDTVRQEYLGKRLSEIDEDAREDIITEGLFDTMMQMELDPGSIDEDVSAELADLAGVKIDELLKKWGLL